MAQPFPSDLAAGGIDETPRLDARRFSVELAVLAAVALAAEWALTGRAGGHALHPHPYWLFVLPLAAARGVSAGLLAATAATVFYLGRHPALADGVPATAALRALREPLLFYGAAWCVGLSRDVLAGANRGLQRRLHETEEALVRARAERDRALGGQAAGPAADAGARVSETERTQSESLFQLAVDLAAERCGLPACALAVRGDASMDPIAFSRGEEDPGDRFAALSSSALVRRVRRQGVGTTAEPGASDGLAACAAPLFDQAGFLRAVLCLEGAAAVDEETARTFHGIAEWASAGLARAQRGGELLDAAVAGRLLAFPRKWLGSPDDLDERLHTEFERFVRHDVPMSVLAIQATRWTDATESGRAELDRFILDTVGAGLRVTDTLYTFDWPGCYVLVLMGTSASASAGVLTRLQSKLSEHASESVGPLEFHVASPGVETPDCNDLIEQVAEQFRAASPLSLGSRAQVLSGGPRRVGDAHACLRRLELELHAALRTGGDVAIVDLTVDHPEAGDPGALAGVFEPALQTSLRRSDGAYALGANRLMLVLPHTGADEAGLVAARLRERLEDVRADFGRVHASSHPLDTSASPATVLEGLARDAAVA